MAKHVSDQLDRLVNLLDTAGMGDVGRVVARHVFAKVGVEDLREVVCDLVEAAIDDGDDAGVQEYFESQVKAYARPKVAAAFDAFVEWAK